MSERRLEIVNIRDGSVSERIDVTGRSEREIEKVIRGILINMDRENWIVRDTAWDTAT